MAQTVAAPAPKKSFFKKPGVRIPLKIISLIFKFICTVLLIGVITGSVVAVVMVVYISNNFSGKDIPDLTYITTNETSIIYVQDATGNWVENTRLDSGNSIWTDFKDIPLNMQNAVIAIEDERFREHYGVDWKRTISAFANMMFHFSSNEYGGSTLTQQLIKTVTNEDEHNIQRKITEILRAIYMEKVYTKDQILEAYLNVLPLSGTIVGVGAAAQQYFGVDCKDLDLAQCALIASITQNPSKYNPFTHPQNARDRQAVVLYKMHQLGFISDDEYVQASNEELYFHGTTKAVPVWDYYTDMVIDDVSSDLVQQEGIDATMAQNQVMHGGLRIYSYENPVKQGQIEAIYKDDKNFPAKIEGDTADPQAAIFIMDYQGKVVAVAGGRGAKTTSLSWDIATMSARQCGSSIKPLATYGPAINLDVVDYSSLIHDAPITKNWPVNAGYTSAGDHGYVTLTYGLRKSLNTVAVQTLQMVTLDYSFKFLTETLGFTHLVDADKSFVGIGLGGLTYGVTCREMAAGFEMFGDGGLHYKPMSYEKVTDSQNVVILQNNTSPIQAIDAGSAYVVNRLLQKVVTDGTATSLKPSWVGWQVFGKTGTSGGSKANSTYNVYFSGGTPEYVAASWFGYDKDKPLKSSQTAAARNLWNKCMLTLRNNDLQDKTFDSLKADTVEYKFCTESGDLATTTCPSTEIGVYKPSKIPDYCTEHGGTPDAVITAGTGTDTTTAATEPTNQDDNPDLAPDVVPGQPME